MHVIVIAMHSQHIDYLGIFIQFIFAAGFVVTTMVVTHLIGPKRKTEQKLENF